MPSLAWIDDDIALAVSYVAQVEPLLPPGWTVVVESPLATVDLYHDWIQQNDVVVLLLDERLGEKAPPGQSHVDYRGHDVVRELRETRPEFPVFMVTSWSHDLDEKKGQLDGIIQKRDFQSNVAAYVERFVRSSMRYCEARRRDLNRMSELSAVVARGNATKQNKAELRALQTYLVAVVPVDLTHRSEVLDKLQKGLVDLDDLRQALDRVLTAEKGGK